MSTREWQRRNGLQAPYTKRQIFAVCVVVSDGILYVVLDQWLKDLLPDAWRWLLVLAFTCSWIAVAVFGIGAMRADPVDNLVKFPPSETVAETLPFCPICKVSVQAETKHCWDCQKCVARFDHHCPWLNNCVGAGNYVSFFASIVALLFMLSILMVATTAAILKFELDFDSIEKVIVLLAVLGIHIPIWLLDAGLLSLHCFLCVKGITTYELLTGKVPSPPSQSKVPRRPSPSPDVIIIASGLHESKLPSVSHPSTPGEGEQREVMQRVHSGQSTNSTLATEVQREVNEFIFGPRVAACPLDHPPSTQEDLEACPEDGAEADVVSDTELAAAGPSAERQAAPEINVVADSDEAHLSAPLEFPQICRRPFGRSGASNDSDSREQI
mmetsp:Transcript_50348/g.93096  ORF Transcript_50348/g.93096 Transcript_50348/m.93096 type:complete len:384 (-) Transcript_50348:10-1161(-)